MAQKKKVGRPADQDSVHKISVIVPKNPFAPRELQGRKHCLCALDVEKLMAWWPGKPHAPHRDAQKVKNIQRSLDWKRVAQIASYLLQEEIVGAPEKLDQVFADIYEPKKNEPGRQWPPKIPKVVGYQRSEFPTFSNVLIHVNGAKIEAIPDLQAGAATLVFDESNHDLNFSVIDGQHRINGAFLAGQINKIRGKEVTWEIPAEIFLDLDAPGDPPRRQAQIFIDVNFYQKKVDRSLVADLFPTARGRRAAFDSTERAQDIGRRLMLDVGPLVGLVQIPGIRFGAKDVITLATLNSAIEEVIEAMESARISSLEAQAEFLAMCLQAWLEASGRFEQPSAVRKEGLSSENVVYQGRVIVAVLALVPAMILELRNKKIAVNSEQARNHLTTWLQKLAKRAGLIKDGAFLEKDEFKERRYLGAGGLALFRDVLWAAAWVQHPVKDLDEEELGALAQKNREKVEALLRQAEE
jgi:DGQHR domain-containing protein